jgi:DNA processing protein
LDATFDLLTLSLLPGISTRTARALARRGRLEEQLARPGDHPDLIPAPAQQRLRSGQARREAQEEWRRAREMGIRIVGRDEPEYPALLREIYDPPPVLYVRGWLRAGEGGRCLAIVGSRAATPRGAALARAMAHELGAGGATIVSGLARGIDTAAHLGALDAEARTVAVLGSGLDRMYPQENARLATRIAGRGAVVSEFRLGAAPKPGHFPRRNRMIAGWGRAVVVVEAASRSGALATARVALDEGREVMAVPGHPSQAGAAGVNQLIRDGAVLVRHGADVAEELGLELASGAEADVEDTVLAVLSRDVPQNLEQLHERCGMEVPQLLARLGELELAERVRRLPGAVFVRA